MHGKEMLIGLDRARWLGVTYQFFGDKEVSCCMYFRVRGARGVGRWVGDLFEIMLNGGALLSVGS